MNLNSSGDEYDDGLSPNKGIFQQTLPKIKNNKLRLDAWDTNDQNKKNIK